MSLSTDQVLALAPDAAVAKAGAGLAAARRWSGLGGDGEGRAAWGECQGSGTRPYRTQIALADLASRCACPSRKRPCKHALGLLLLLTAEPELFAVAELPAWVAEWLTERATRSERRGERAAAEADALADAESARAAAVGRSRRTAARAEKATAGLAELAHWLEDLVRAGVASVVSQPASFWDTTAARLVDAQLPGVARSVRQLAVTAATGPEWPERFVAAVGRLHLLGEAYGRIDALADDVRADVRAALGWPVTFDDGPAAAPVPDEWVVLGQVTEMEDRLRARRTWLAGRRSGRHALLLDFAHGDTTFAESVPAVGQVLDAELAFFPGTTPLRAAVHTRGAAEARAPSGTETPLPSGHARLADATQAWSAAVARNPWTERAAVVLNAAVPERAGERWRVRDVAGDSVAIAPRFRAVWPLAALSGGRSVWLAGEWDGDALLPLSAAGADGVIVSLAHVLEAAR